MVVAFRVLVLVLYSILIYIVRGLTFRITKYRYVIQRKTGILRYLNIRTLTKTQML